MRPSHLFLVTFISAGCDPRDAELRMERLRLEHRSLLEELDRLEDRMLADQARVRFWEEMQERHQSVTAVACSNLDSHLADMVAVAKRNHEAQARLQHVAGLWTRGRK